MISSSRVIIGVGMLLIVAALAGVGYYFWQPTSTEEPVVTMTPTPTASAAPEEPSPSPTPGPLSLYYIALEDGGVSGSLIGCGDSLIKVSTGSVTVSDPVEAALKQLLANHQKEYGASGLYNALYQSDLTYQSSTFQDGTAAVYLEGSLIQGGACDAPRIEAQLKQTVQSASKTEEVKIFVNNQPLEDVLQLKE